MQKKSSTHPQFERTSYKVSVNFGSQAI